MSKAMRLDGVSYRHRVNTPRKTNPWAKSYGQGIHDVDLNIPKASIMGLIGPNGAGKTTLLRIITGLYKQQSGTIDLSLAERRQKTGFMPEQVRWEGRTSVAEALHEIQLMNGIDSSPEKLLQIVGLSKRADTPLDELSQGMRQRLSLACALVGDPEILVLDEPMNGLDPLAQRAFAELLRKLAKKGVAVIISSHQVAGMIDLVDSIALLHRGQLLIQGDVGTVAKSLDVGQKIVISGSGIPPEGMEKNGDGWTGVLEGEPEEIISTFQHQGLEFISPQPIDMVEMITAATGLSIEETGLEISSSDMVPLKKWGEEE